MSAVVKQMAAKAPHPWLAADHENYSAVTAAISDPDPETSGRKALVGCLHHCLALRLCDHCSDRRFVHQGCRHMGREHDHRLGLCDRELCLVDRDWQRRHINLLDAAFDPAALARGDQSFC